MASKYQWIETATFIITNGSEKNWVNLRKEELMTIPWMKEAIEAIEAKLFIDDCLGFDIKSVTDAGVIELKNGNILRISKNIKRACRLELTEYYRNAEGLWELDPNYPRDIHSATVSTNFGTLSDGFRVFTDGERKYLYNKEGKERLYVPPVYDDDYYCSCCSHDYDYEWD
jgi:hypothetical protein